MPGITTKRNGKEYHRTGMLYKTKASAIEQQRAAKRNGHKSFLSKEKGGYVVYINLD